MPLLVALLLMGPLIQSAGAPPTATISGRVVEAGTSTPVSGAGIILIATQSGAVRMPFPDRPRTAVTDQDGRYGFDNVEAGRYQITVEKAGFAPPNGLGGLEVVVQAGERRADVNVTLQRAAVIVGRVLDDAGEPLSDVRVTAMEQPPAFPNAPRMQDFLVPVGSGAQSNDLGEFRLFGLPPGSYYVQAMPRPDFGGSSSQRPTTTLPTYFPGTPDPAAAQLISVGAGQTSGDVVIRMVAVPAFSVSGVVLDDARRPVTNAMVRLMAEETPGRSLLMMGSWNQSRTDTSGRFTITNVTNGAYTLIATAPVVVSGPATGGGGGGATSGGSFSSFGFSGGIVGGIVAGEVITEMANGTTIQYRDDTATRVPITINQASVGGLELIVRTPPR